MVRICTPRSSCHGAAARRVIFLSSSPPCGLQGSARDREKREQERQQLQDLVGKNLTYLSQLDGLGYDLYAGMVRARAARRVARACEDSPSY